MAVNTRVIGGLNTYFVNIIVECIDAEGIYAALIRALIIPRLLLYAIDIHYKSQTAKEY
jgi:hypothetical protein